MLINKVKYFCILALFILLSNACSSNYANLNNEEQQNTSVRLDVDNIEVYDFASLVGRDISGLIEALGDEYETISTNYTGTVEQVGIIYNITVNDAPVTTAFEYDNNSITKVILFAEGLSSALIKQTALDVFNEEFSNVTELEPIEGYIFNSSNYKITLVDTGTLLQITFE